LDGLRFFAGRAVALCGALLAISPTWAGIEAPKKAPADNHSAYTARARTYRSPLASGGQGPEMVVVPTGRLQVNNPKYPQIRRPDESPVHDVSIPAFGLGKTNVTRGEFAAFVHATGYKTDAEKNTAVPGATDAEGCFAYKSGKDFGWKAGTSWRVPGFEQDDAHPAVCLSWNDAVAYVEWLKRETGKHYRLPTDAEMEYAIRAGSVTRYAWGSDVDQACQYGNVGDATQKAQFDFPSVSCSDGYLFTSPIAHFQANAFGLFDTVGDALTWTQDCFDGDTGAAMSNDSADTANSRCHRSLRGSSWATGPSKLQSSYRLRVPSAIRYFDTGLRVAQDL
jgi:formylglycine-generating enzyme required for sulfatase activity